MSKLKTLKDITFSKITNYTKHQEDRCKEDLRVEAMKWLKADKSEFYSREGMESTKEWIKHFFNLEEEK